MYICIYVGIVSHAVNANVNAPATWPHSGDGLTGMPRVCVLFVCAMDACREHGPELATQAIRF